MSVIAIARFFARTCRLLFRIGRLRTCTINLPNFGPPVDAEYFPFVLYSYPLSFR